MHLYNMEKLPHTVKFFICKIIVCVWINNNKLIYFNYLVIKAPQNMIGVDPKFQNFKKIQKMQLQLKFSFIFNPGIK